ncbi:putative membrane protein SpoIIM required for sporulation [Mucilaginibacter yixingensis]|uniref:Putative membrane protein SpoIIM required for sporulation n=1 Tax=Mucilaginibacter yixingensis TaxID=1295612 RepID=A0A2T5JCM0_9SPHI|nr:stage II sporulation protein M [Mucilaginibacter yixingensis]PTQ99509.1 putative membrane protein SpoIIM required for sporulation [Mucilaginibacter yixingensis]
MREALFVKQNTARWRKYETEKTSDPDELAERFISITDDLAYAKTFYPQSKTTGYLNGLASGFHQSIYKNRKEKSNRFLSFWRHELPWLFYQHRRELLVSFLFFITFFLIGIFSAKYDGSFIRLVLGDDYVNMTNENIAKGDPFGVYKGENEWLMFWMIAKNNLTVTAITYLFGIVLSVGTLYHLFKNGLMVGCFQYLFIAKGLAVKSILVIWIHGTLEISTIILAGTAGLIMGNSIVFPKTYSRMVSFKKGALNGMKVIIGISPIVVTAAFFEGFVTRHTEMPVWLSCCILGGSAAFIIWYVILYPIYLSQKLKPVSSNERESRPEPSA